jgi:hypothetical protein
MRIVFALLLTLSAAFARVGESDAEFQKRCGGAPVEVAKFENGVIQVQPRECQGASAGEGVCRERNGFSGGVSRSFSGRG